MGWCVCEMVMWTSVGQCVLDNNVSSVCETVIWGSVCEIVMWGSVC